MKTSKITDLLRKTRTPQKRYGTSKSLLTFAFIIVLGLALGIMSKLFDIHTQNLGNIFSKLTVWILIGTLISFYSPSPVSASINIFLFCIFMLSGYYVTAGLLDAVWGMDFAKGWLVFSLFAAVFAFFTWYGKGTGRFAILLDIGIISVMILSWAVFGLDLSDIIIAAVMFIILFKK